MKDDYVRTTLLSHEGIVKLTFPQGVIDNYGLTENASYNDKTNLSVEKLLSKHVRGSILTYVATENNSKPDLKLENVSPSIETVARRFLIVAAFNYGHKHLVDCKN